MTPDIKAKWIEALRGGKYAQVQGKLRTDDGFCCLGVLCDVVYPEEWTRLGIEHQHKGINCFLPDGVRVAAKMPGRLNGEDAETQLVRMNDRGNSFAEIADFIEKHL